VLRDQDIKTFTTTAGGPGGQHQNKTQSAVVMRHLPTGIEASSSERCQHQNKRIARAVLEGRVASLLSKQHQDNQTNNRRAQIGTGEDATKIRTYREKDDLVLDGRNGKKARLSDVIKGNLEKILN
jgi:peptide chain release factor 1